MIKISWFGTATILIETKDEKLLFDPFFRMNKKLEQPALEEFCKVDYIFNTHPHFDHLCDVPNILKNTNAKIYGTPTMYLRLETQGVDVEKKTEILCPHDTLTTKNCEINSFRTKHVKNDLKIILKTAMRVIYKFQFKKATKILKTHNQYRMNGDILAFQVKTEGKNILIFGSAGYDENSQLPTNVDMLIWPFQGRSNMTKYSLPIIEKIAPKKILLDHFDDAFPPITQNVKLKKFIKVMNEKHPEIEIIVPKYKATYKI